MRFDIAIGKVILINFIFIYFCIFKKSGVWKLVTQQIFKKHNCYDFVLIINLNIFLELQIISKIMMLKILRNVSYSFPSDISCLVMVF